MKKAKLFLSMKMLLTLLAFFAFAGLQAQPASSEVILANDVVISPNVVEFDLYVKSTNNSGYPVGFPYGGGQYRINFNQAIRATPSTQIFFEMIAGSTELANTAQVPPSVTNPTLTQGFVRLTGPLPVPYGAASIISNLGNGTKIIRMRMISRVSTADPTPVPFAPGTQANLTLSTSSPGATTTSYVLPTGTTLFCTPQILLNNQMENLPFPGTCVNPDPFMVSGGGSYCAGGPGVSINMSGSQVGVNYTLNPGGLMLPGTGFPLTFVNIVEPAAYTVTALSDGTDPGLCLDPVLMPGGADVSIIPLEFSGVSIVADPAGPVCANTVVIFTATPDNGGVNPFYEWFINGLSQNTPSMDNTFTTAPANGDQVYVVMTPDFVCSEGNPESNTIIMEVNPLLPVSVGIEVDLNDVCAGTEVTFTATPVNGGSEPQYTWYVNGTGTPGNDEFTYVPANGDEVYVSLFADLTQTCLTGNPAVSEIIEMIVNPIVTATFAPIGPFCQGDVVPPLPAASLEGITGTWTPPTINNMASGCYEFMPDAGQCAEGAVLCVTINAPVATTFDPMGPYCQNSTAPALPATSLEGFTGTWDPATISTTVLGESIYTFTPAAGQCATTGVLYITIATEITPVFTQIGPLCQGSVAPALPGTSNNGITGGWVPATINTADVGITEYAFTPDAGQCAIGTLMNIEVVAPVVPAFDAIGPLCQGSAAPALPLVSNNGVAGTWNPASISTAVAGSFDFLFTPDGGCTTTAPLTVVVNPLPAPAGDISGPASVTEGDLAVGYSVNPIAYAVTYSWFYTGTGVTINGSSPAVTLDFAIGATSGDLFVLGTNACGQGMFSVLNITVEPLVIPCPDFSTWVGDVSEDWFTAENWDPELVPCENTEVIIGEVAPGNFNPTIEQQPTNSVACLATITDLTITDGASLIGQQYLCVLNDAVVERTIVNSNFHLISSPVDDVTFGDVFLPAYWFEVWAREYNEPSGDWMNQFITDHLAVGSGYSVQMTTAPQTATFTGMLNGYDVTRTLSNMNPGTDLNRVGWNLLGNPFPSAIDWDVFSTGDYDGQVAVWDEVYGNYRKWNGTTGDLPGGIIPAQQGFFVKTTTNGAALTIPMAAQVHSPMALYKDAVANALELRANGNNYGDATFVHFNSNATADFDSQYDAFKLEGLATAPQLYNMAAGYNLSINELPFEGNEVVNLGFKCGVEGTYSLNASGLESFSSSTPILLEDLKLNILQDLRLNPVYSFNYATNDSEARFKLHFKAATGIADPATNGIFVYSYERTVVINNTTNLNGEIRIFDMTGRELKDANMSAASETRLPLQVAVGTYIVKVTTAQGTVNQKVYVK
ncbi:MAG: T9SS type A sorting domain-containing protein [Lentimicrobium sp.]